MTLLKAQTNSQVGPLRCQNLALALRRDTLVSVEYSEELNFTTSSATYQRTNRHGILGQKPSDFQRFL
jgi:hypothetical protein